MQEGGGLEHPNCGAVPSKEESEGRSACSGSVGVETAEGSSWGTSHLRRTRLVSDPACSFALLVSGGQNKSSPLRLPHEQSLL